MTEKTAEQLTLFDQDIWCGKTSQELSAQKTVKTSVRSSKKSAELRTTEYVYLDLRAGYGSLLGPYWERNSPLLGEYWMLNTGPSPNVARESSLSAILEDTVPEKYYLSKTACLGILRRAEARGKELPPQLREALMIQAGVA